ncbi:MAG TPA: SusC/RagA family TonB-linked outer membrane protein [Longimicrobiales bacterium]|nr:SusC/RagA family TonB-linked outer membrane protein [Longimicrobiales bacterium]
MKLRPTTILPGLLAAVLSGVAALPIAAQQGSGRVQGRVTSARDLRALAGAQVFVPGTGIGALTDAQGRYTIAGVPAGRTTVRVQMLGYSGADKSVDVAAGATATLDFQLGETAVALDQLVVTGTAAASRRREVGNSISSIGAQAIQNSAVATPKDALQGRAPGLTILENGGHPGAGATIRLRGINSISQDNTPVIYVDGVRIYNQLIPAGYGGRQGYLPLDDIAPEDIDRIEIVKGAAATTLYGTEASGGVIQIFTKHGAAGAPIWNAEISAGVNNMGHIGPKEDASGYHINDCTAAATKYLNLTTGQLTPYVDATCPSSGTYLVNGPVQRYALSVRGGAEKVTYSVSGNYGSENGVLPTSWNKDGGFRANLSFFPMQSVQVSFNNAYTRRHTRWAGDGDNSEGIMLDASRGPASYMDGTKGNECDAAEAANQTCVTNGYVFDAQNFSKGDHYTSGLTVSYAPSEKLLNRLTVGWDYNSNTHDTGIPWGWTGSGQEADGFLWEEQRLDTKLSLDYSGSLINKFMGQKLASTFSWGGQLFEDRHRWTETDVAHFAGPSEPTLSSGATQEVYGDQRQRIINAGLFLQELIGWSDRLFITAGLRVDGNSAFGENFGLQPYPKLSAAYILSDAKFWPSWWETMKLRFAVGESGKAPGAFDAVRTWSPIADGNGSPGFTPSQIGNPDLGPERTREIEGGFDASLFQGRLGVEATYYNARTSDALVDVTFPPSQGFLNSQLQNVGTLANSGVELALNLGLITTPGFDWRLRANGSLLRSKAVDLGGQELYTGFESYVREGYPIPTYFGNRVKNPDAIANPDLESNQPLGPIYPTRLLGIGTTMTFAQRLTLEVQTQGSFGGHLENDVAWNAEFRGTWGPCIPVQQKMIAAKKGDAHALDDVTALWRAKCSLTRAGADKAFWTEPADFFKVRNVSLSYNLPARLVPGASAASIMVSGRNLFRWTNYTGADPEVLEVEDASNSGGTTILGRRDYYNFPPYRTFMASLRVTF